MSIVFLISVFLLLTINTISSQVYLDPNPVLCSCNYFKGEELYIEKIELTETATIVHYEYAFSHEWANIRKDAFIFDIFNGEKYRLIKSEGLPVAPEKRYFKEIDQDQPFKFKLHFERIPDTLRQFDIVECMENSCFNTFNISLDLNNEKANHIAEYVNSNIPFMLWKFFYLSIGEPSVDEAFYQDLLKDEKAFSVEDRCLDPDSDGGDFYKRIIRFKYNENKIVAVFNAKRQSFNLLKVSIDFDDPQKAIEFIREFSCLFHMRKESDDFYINSVIDYRNVIRVKDDVIDINYNDILELSNNKKLK